VRYVPVDAALRFDLDAWRELIRADRGAGLLPLLVVATAGTTGGGIVDPLPELAAICREEAMWFHVDAAWGGAACLSPLLRPSLAGIERADSITWDAHKWLSVPMGAGMFFCAHPEAVGRTFEIGTPYMPRRTEDTTDPYRTTIQWSRRHIGLKVFMSLAAFGVGGYRDAIEHQARLGDLLRVELQRRGWRIVNQTPLPVVCFTHPLLDEGVLSARTVASRLREKNFWVSDVRLGGGSPVLRACITSYRTRPEDVKALASAAAEIVRGRGES
jgi:glutamate/tyrosine decarboxylase-like PLP-dependent enzyme